MLKSADEEEGEGPLARGTEQGHPGKATRARSPGKDPGQGHPNRVPGKNLGQLGERIPGKDPEHGRTLSGQGTRVRLSGKATRARYLSTELPLLTEQVKELTPLIDPGKNTRATHPGKVM
ncbi:hypothetical protein Dimus_006488 [Dionaea muscipula]